MPYQKKALIFVETNIGVGHMPVAAQLAQALRKQSVQVYIMSSDHSREQGELFDFSGCIWCTLPNFTKDPKTGKFYSTTNGVLYDQDAAFQNKRAEFIAGYIQSIRPDVMVTETFPLGKTFLHKEMIPAFEACSRILQKCKLYSVGRDVLNYGPLHPGEHCPQTALDILNTYYDGIIITGDEEIFTMHDSFALTDQLKIPVHYAGYFSPPSQPPDPSIKESAREVLVTTGGGYVPDVYDQIVTDAIKARAHTTMNDRVWRVLIGHAYPGNLKNYFQDMARQHAPDGGIIVESVRPDFSKLLANCAGVIATGGLNSTMEALQVRKRRPIPVIIAPIGTMPPNPTAQIPRTKKLAALGLIGAHYPDQFGSAENLATIFNADSARGFSVTDHCIKMDGAVRAAAIITQFQEADSLYVRPSLPVRFVPVLPALSGTPTSSTKAPTNDLDYR